MAQKIKHTMGERLNIRFNGKIKLEFHGARLTSDGGLLAHRDLDEALGLFKSVSTVMSDGRTRRNIQLIESFLIWTVQKALYMESRKVQHTTVIIAAR